MENEVLTLSKDDQLRHYERVIEEGLETFVQVGDALLAIKEGKLYQRKGYKTFEQYCQDEWQMGRAHAYRLTDAAVTMQNLSPMGDKMPENERQARPLTALKDEPEAQRQAWQEVIETAPDGKITTSHVEAVVEKYLPPAPEPLYAGGDAASPPAVQSRHAVHYSSETPEHYTPRDVIERVVQCLGRIDLDPCSNLGIPNVPADRHFTIENDGLSQWWQGRVYMNPPYGSEIGQWVDKLCAEYDSGSVSEAIALVPARTDTAWFVQLTAGGPMVCFVYGRLRFAGEAGPAENSAPFPSAIVYFGENWRRFVDVFSPIGRIFQEVTP